jgi:hypothetical protein
MNSAPTAPPPYRKAPGVVSAPPAVPAKPDQKTELEYLASQISIVANSIPTPGVTDSYLHSKTLTQAASRLREMAKGL